MNRLGRVGWAAAAAFSLALTAVGQSAPSAAVSLGQEPLLYKQLTTVAQFENDGTMRREQRAAIEVQTPPGVAQAGNLVFGYNSANEHFEVKSIRVKTAAGSLVTVGTDAVRDLPLPVQQVAPVYSDYHEVHITVPDVAVGAEVDYDIVMDRFAPLAPGQFWFEYTFSRQPAVRDEQLTIDVPADRALTLRTQPGYAASQTTEAGRTVYQWHPPAPAKAPEQSQAETAGTKPPPPDVQLTTFSSWAAVGAWYRTLQRVRLALTPQIVAKAKEITTGQATERGKVEALYDFVAQNIRYVSLSFGLGRYQPHAAAQVLANEYGDCKDQETLLAALLTAAGIPAAAALVSTTRAIDPAVPSPAQFNHVITVAPASGGPLWMDTTTSVAAFQMLFASIRGQEALVIPPQGPARLERTPQGPPMPALEADEVTATVNDAGQLAADVAVQESGDGGLILRLLLHELPAARWPLLDRSLMAAFWTDGTISASTAENLALTAQPLRLRFHFTSGNYWDPSGGSEQLNLPRGILVPKSAATGPVRLGWPGEVRVHLVLHFPAGCVLTAPLPVSLDRPYARYRSSYQVEGDTLVLDRDLVTLERELPVAQRDDFAAFRRAVEADEAQAVGVAGTVALAPASGKGADFYQAGEAAYAQGDDARAASLLERASRAPHPDPEVWNELGRVYLAQGRPRQALGAFQHQIADNPYDPYAYNNAGLAQMRLGDWSDAAEEFQKQIEIAPLDRYAHGNLGSLDAVLGRYDLAIPELEKAAAIAPDDANVHFMLGVSLGETGKTAEAAGELEKAADIAASAPVWSRVAYLLAQHDREPQRAEDYAHRALAADEATMGQESADRMHATNLAQSWDCATAWAALGMAKSDSGDMASALPYLRVSWQLTNSLEPGRVLAEAEMKLGNKQQAAAIYAQLATQEGEPGQPLPPSELAKLGPGAKLVQARLKARDDLARGDQRTLATLIGGADQIPVWEDEHRLDLQGARTITVKSAAKADGNAEVLLRLAAAGMPGRLRWEVSAAQWLSGDEAMKAELGRLQGATARLAVPPEGGILVLRGVVSCAEAAAESSPRRCLVVLVPLRSEASAAFYPNTGVQPAGEVQLQSGKP